MKSPHKMEQLIVPFEKQMFEQGCQMPMFLCNTIQFFSEFISEATLSSNNGIIGHLDGQSISLSEDYVSDSAVYQSLGMHSKQ